MAGKHNVRFITLDSCRYDTAIKANLTTLNTISKLIRAEVDANYTYPSHHSMFIGILPRKCGANKQYIEGYDQIWRSGGARVSEKKVFEFFGESNIIEHYQSLGYNVQGFGGVQFFNPKLGCNLLPKMFNNFTFFGPDKYIREENSLPRNPKNFPLGNIEFILNKIYAKKEDPYFLFINCPETHNPYDTPSTKVDDNYRDLIKRLNLEHSTKITHPLEKLPLTFAEIDLLKNEQVRALEWIDQKLSELFTKLPNNYPTLTIVLSDHGEEFGEEGRFGHAHNAESVRTIPLWVSYTE